MGNKKVSLEEKKDWGLLEKKQPHKGLISFVFLGLLLSACSSPQTPLKPAEDLCTGTKKPYQIKGVTYTPQDHYHYEEEGEASWYGPGFHEKPGSCGSKYDMHAYTAAHKTLPIPSVVEVTNVENGRQVTLVVNDRGPFVGSRIIDLSKKAAVDLGTHAKGVSNVRVRALPEESVALANYLKKFGRYGMDPSGRSWDVIYRDEVAGKDQSQLLVQTNLQTQTHQDHFDEMDLMIVEAMERSAKREIQEPITESISQPTVASVMKNQPKVQQVSYKSKPLPMGKQEEFDLFIEDLTTEDKKTIRKKISVDRASKSSSGVIKSEKKSQRQSNHFIQVGSFVNKEKAQKLVSSLSAYGKAKVVKETPYFFTVQLGPYPSPKRAKQVMSTVMNKGHHGVRVIGG